MRVARGRVAWIWAEASPHATVDNGTGSGGEGHCIFRRLSSGGRDGLAMKRTEDKGRRVHGFQLGNEGGAPRRKRNG